MNKIDTIRSVLKRNRSKKGLTMNEVVAKSGVAYSTARRHMTRLLEREQADYAEFYKVDPVTKNEVTAYVSA